MTNFACRDFSATPAVSRRTLIRVGSAGLLGLGMPGLLRAAEANRSAPAAAAAKIRAKRVIFLFQWGGPSHVDMFDMKPNAPDDYRSPLTTIRSSCPEIQVCEELPETAKRMHKVSLIRTLTHTMKNHNSAGYYALSGHAPPTDDQRLRDSLDLFPSYGSVVDRLAPSKNGMPTFVSYPYTISDGSITPGQHASFLGKANDPLFFTEDPNSPDFKLPELSLPDNLTLDRLHRRREMQRIVDRQARLLEYSAEARGFDDYYDRAIGMLTSEKVRNAFDLSAESAEVRDR